ncbi:hypothetical protein F5613_000455 [Macellibacteroides fermentans]|uniref:Uncharacterized protein n=1 Tax=Macellibacteroides fermentans TaxID=879969 RepID=A0A8E2D478_9PORP|nr:hypothetical protein [Macellibacteroides fermentans]
MKIKILVLYWDMDNTQSMKIFIIGTSGDNGQLSRKRSRIHPSPPDQY